MKRLWLFGLMLLAGCGPYKVTVYGASGKPYVAPDLCAAQLACKQANESACYYTTTVTVDQENNKMVDEQVCKKVK